MSPSRQCVKVAELRKCGYSDLRQWMATEGNVLVTRHGRIFIDKVIFHYPASEWGNPFPVKDYTLEGCLLKYEEYLRNTVKNEEVKQRFLKLKEAKYLGCFCESRSACHADIILKVLAEL